MSRAEAGLSPLPAPALRRTPVAGVRISTDRDLLVVHAEHDLVVASSAVLGGGVRRGRTIVSARVPHGYDGLDPASDVRAAARRHAVSPDVGLMTAVPLDRAAVATAVAGGVGATIVASVGAGAPVAAGGRPRRHVLAGTVNLIAIIDRALGPAALLNLIATLTEAKVLALVEHDVRTAAGERASGTASDAVVAACPADGEPLPFGGPATPAGRAAALAAREAMRVGLARDPRHRARR